MSMIKAIETEYAGCRFRSRLEARWAVFFDRLGVEWEHEPDGFETAAGRYLPDFRIRASWRDSRWFEVKPPNFPHDPRHDAFVRDTGERLIVAAGMCRDYRSQYQGGPLALLAAGEAPIPVSLHFARGPGLTLHHLGGPSSCSAIDAAYKAARSERFGT
jgi:hypothetical protein